MHSGGGVCKDQSRSIEFQMCGTQIHYILAFVHLDTTRTTRNFPVIVFPARTADDEPGLMPSAAIG